MQKKDTGSNSEKIDEKSDFTLAQRSRKNLLVKVQKLNACIVMH